MIYRVLSSITDTKARAEMLDETIDILTQLYQRKQFDFDGQYFPVKLTRLDEMYYPPKPVQQPRIPIWTPVIWPLKKSIPRILRCDGVIPEKVDADGNPQTVTPADVAEIKAYVDNNRTLTTPFDIVINAKPCDSTLATQREDLLPWAEAGATWWVEDFMGATEAEVMDRIRRGPPRLG